MQLSGSYRSSDGSKVQTDHGNVIYDAVIPEHVDLQTLNRELNAMPGVLDHGLFLTEADELYIEDARGAVTHRSRSA